MERLAEFFPFTEKGAVSGFAPVEFFGLALTFFCAYKILQRRFALRDRCLSAVDLRFQFANAIFHLLALDRIKALRLGGCGRSLDRGMIAVCRGLWNGFDHFQL